MLSKSCFTEPTSAAARLICSSICSLLQGIDAACRGCVSKKRRDPWEVVMSWRGKGMIILASEMASC